jgi:hypothetical protein
MAENGPGKEATFCLPKSTCQNFGAEASRSASWHMRRGLIALMALLAHLNLETEDPQRDLPV